MGLFDRLKNAASPRSGEPEGRVRALPDPGDAPVRDLPLTPESRRIGDEERARIAEALAVLESEGVDVGDLGSIAAGLDRALVDWQQRHGDDHDGIVQRYAIGIGEHLVRTTDLAWSVVTDVFGTDLAVSAGDFVVVPSNLVAVRWMRRETGWVPRVVGHIVELRNR
ncbi:MULTISPECIES: hypothetical protein [unclassified Ornithinimicrobium]|uniref:hypothetical protein n=1 Tax=unclassified Ornithinimicrobium TaxID=2615080 RepID=UPI00385183F1